MTKKPQDLLTIAQFNIRAHAKNIWLATSLIFLEEEELIIFLSCRFKIGK
jgi:hypothetical protein